VRRRIVFSSQAKADVAAILQETRRTYGPAQVKRYRALLTEARRHLLQFPGQGHRREGLPDDWRLFHIRQPGRNAAHFYLYIFTEVDNRIDVLRVLHESMDVSRHWSTK